MPSAAADSRVSEMPATGSGRRLVLSAGIYVVGTFLQRGLLFVSLPLYARLFGVDDYARWSLFIALSAVFGLIFDLAWSRGIPRLFYEYWQDERVGREYLYVSFLQRLLLSIGAAIAFLILAPPLLSWASGGVIPFDRFGTALLVAASAECLLLYVCSAHRARQRAIPFVVLKLAQVSAQIGGSLAAVYWLGASVGTAATIFAFGSGAVAMLGVAHFLRGISTRRSGTLAFGETFRVNFVFSAPLVFHDLASWLRNAADPFIIAHFLNLYAVSVYHVGYQFGLIIGLLLYSVELALSPFLFQLMKVDPEFRQKYLEITHLIVGCTFALVVTTILFCREAIGVLFPASLGEAARIAPLVAAGYFFHGLYTVYVKPIVFHGRTELIPLLTSGPTLFGVALSVAVTPLVGVIAPAYVTILSLALLATIVYRSAQRLDRFEYPITLHAVLAAAVVALGFGCSWFWDATTGTATGAKAAIWTLLMLTTYALFFRGRASRMRAMIRARGITTVATDIPLPIEREHGA